MQIHGIAGLTSEAIRRELAAGGRFVVFEYCISVVIATSRRSTDPYFLCAGELGVARGLPFSLLSLLVGWWGIPWGVIYTPLVLITNLSGGRDVTGEITPFLESGACGQPGGESVLRPGVS
jgi:hypothetical protein